MTGRDPGAFDLPPVKIGRGGPPGGHRPDRVRIAIVVVVVALALAVIKPWGDDSTANPSALSSPIVASSSDDPASSLEPTDPLVADAALTELRAHRSWGVVTVAAGLLVGNDLEVRPTWQRAVPTAGGPVAPLIVADDGPVVLIGVTAPLAETPLDTRIWARGHDGGWHWLWLRPIPTGAPGADLLFQPPIVDGLALPNWPPGRYRIDLLMGSFVARIDLTIDRASAAADAPVSTVPDRPIREDRIWRDDIPIGPFALIDGVVQPLVGRSEPGQGAAEAWLGADRSATVWQPAISGLGAILPADARDPRGVIRRLSPEPTFGGPVAQLGSRPTPNGAGAPFIEFAMPVGQRFEPGVYVMEVAWHGARGDRVEAWAVTLLPGPAEAPVPTLLAAARAFRAHAGTDAVVVGPAVGPGPPIDRGLEDFPTTRPIGCSETVALGAPRVLGLASPVDVSIDRVEAALERPLGRVTEVPLRIARDVQPGLTLVAPAETDRFPAGIYRLSMDRDGHPKRTSLCLGTSSLVD